ncbi:SPFH domain-containing protein [Poriferisphaera sp. WC338]|uniref:SPFH domain-containing protein n=1 Tax=Poriferisphaera sp. WC338 TaxID=3425129 RepID=UPI003D817A0D
MKKHRFIFGIAVFVVLTLVAYMMFFTVRYDQVAVLTVLNKATAPAYENGQLKRNPDGSLSDPGSVIEEPGIKFRLPWPFSDKKIYSKRVQLLEDQLQELQTADGHSVDVQLYLAWKIEDPYAFYRSMENEVTANKTLKSLMANFSGIISSYNFDQLVNLDPELLKLVEIESRCAAYLRDDLAGYDPSYGIKIEKVGIRRLVIPEDITPKVFERMRTTRESLAEAARAEGAAKADRMRNEAETIKKQILAFAERRAQAIRDEGDREAAKFFDAFSEDEEFAIFLKQIRSLEKMLPVNTQFILDAQEIGLSELFKKDELRVRSKADSR